MTSPKLLLVLMAAASSLAAPQINERQVVEDVVVQLGPAIRQALASLNLGSSSFSSRSTSSGSGFNGATGVSSLGSRFSGSTGSTGASLAGSRFSGATGATRGSSASVSSLTSSVVASLQPSIAAAVAGALGRFRGSVGTRATTLPIGIPVEEQYGPAEYDFSYRVADNEAQNYIAQQEHRSGEDVTGSYNYVDSTGALVTVNYEAGPQGYTENRDVQKGAVVMRNIPGPWTGPLAGVDDEMTASTGSVAAKHTGRGQGMSQSALIAQILAAIQPQINSAVQSAIHSSSSIGTRASGLGQNSFVSSSLGQGQNRFVSSGRGQNRFVSSGQNSLVSSRRAGSSTSSSQGNIISSVISSLQPAIESAVSSALSSTRTRTVTRPRTLPTLRSTGASSGNIEGLFGTGGGSHVEIETPEFRIEY